MVQDNVRDTSCGRNPRTTTMVQPKPDDVEIPDDTTWEELSPYQRYYYKNRESEIERANADTQEKIDWVREYRAERGCSECGEDHPACLDFHHVEEKEYAVHKMARDGYSLDKIKEEVEKCIVLCANCHRKRHAELP
ncbi:HNH endonuclease [Haloarcula virus HCTV-16]|nr:HNH endonuclease [Haloarcula virus HCTV-16]